ncbi:MAG: 2,3,4,5-tetrahydropyridine-2,6-dicarboxylate N-succinyltransferase [Porticoccaceae bacterium]|jgi:2,3,4,5-tetrahydropyridine-2,6-dicarboxylate N-succinyltransferase|nr:2,3,4,5-tetrahydropyridine-2,6-dicarboxylate N-succinyltransferase [Porticoccaceae bacterium]
MTTCYSLAIGSGTLNNKNDLLEVWYPKPLLKPEQNIVDAVAASVGLTTTQLDDSQATQLSTALEQAGEKELSDICRALVGGSRAIVICVLEQDSAPTDVPSAYLKLHLLSHRLVKPHQTVLDGVFGVLPNNAWTSEGAIDPADLVERQLAARLKGESIQVNCMDKFPKMTDYVVPSGVRIADASRVRLGAYLGEGTTIMHEGFVNFNAGTEGPNMIEGRISAGVFIGKGSDLGGGCSTMGTLSGGGNVVIAVGENCLIGANAGIGIGLGDRCTVEAGLYITAGTKVNLLDESGSTIGTPKAADLSGKSDLLFRRNSLSGAIECLTNKSAIELNEELHKHN